MSIYMKHTSCKNEGWHWGKNCVVLRYPGVIKLATNISMSNLSHWLPTSKSQLDLSWRLLQVNKNAKWLQNTIKIIPREANNGATGSPNSFRRKSWCSVVPGLGLGVLRTASWTSRREAKQSWNCSQRGLPIRIWMRRSCCAGFVTSTGALLDVFLKAMKIEGTSREKNVLKLKSYKNTCVFTIGLHIDFNVNALGNLETCINWRLGSCVVLSRGWKLPSNLILTVSWPPKRGLKLAPKACETILKTM